MDDETLRDRIYEAALLPDLWPTNCDLISAAVDGYSMAVVSITPEGSQRYTCSPRIAGLMEAYHRTDLPPTNERPKRALRSMPAVFARDIDLMTQAELAVDPIYEAFLRPNGLGSTAGAIFLEPTGSHLVFDLVRRADRGPFTVEEIARLNGLKADLARAAFLTTRLSFQEARTIADALSAVGLPVAVLDDGGRALAMNPELEALAPRIRTGYGDRVVLGDPASNRLLKTTLQRLKRNLVPEVQSIPVTAEEGAPPLVIQLVPVRRTAREVFSRATTILLVTTVGEVGPPDLRVISGLFDLTRAEARVAQQLAMGKSGIETAEALGVAYDTIRAHLKAVFRKTGVRRQGELVALLGGIGAAPSR